MTCEGAGTTRNNSAADGAMFFNRELSWLRFNTRVLGEAKNARLPLLERLKFMAIYSTNMDEFYMIRVAGLKKLFSNGVTKSGPDNIMPLEQLRGIRKYIHAEKNDVEEIFLDVKKALVEKNIFLHDFADLSRDDKEKMGYYFTSYLYPVIVPIVIDSQHPFPHLNNLSFAIALKLKNNDTGCIKYGMVRIPRVLKRFIEVNKGQFVLVENVVGEFASELFSGYSTLAYMPFRVTRNADIEIEEDEADDFIVLMSEGLRARRKGEIVRLEVGLANNREEHASLLNFVNNHVNVFKGDLYEYNMALGPSAFWEIIGSKEFAHLNNVAYSPKVLPPLQDANDIFACIDDNDILMFHPYESFDPVVKFVQSAAHDPSVLSIRMTLYRVGKNSPIIKALTEAAENKQVTVLVELKARFDEENNLHWAKALESAGAHIIYGVPSLKVHAKIALVVRMDGGKPKQYVHLSTGNYSTQTAKIYTDVSLLTSNENFAKDAIKLFHSLSTGSAKTLKLDTLFSAPMQIKTQLLNLIEAEMKYKDRGRIILKANACVDQDVIQALYKASNEGVMIDLIIRGICCLVPGVPGMSENIRVVSIVGKYLEHARIYYFKHAHNHVYFSSADIMPRNLERRVEILVPILQKHARDKLLHILTFQLGDNIQSYELRSDGEYRKISTAGTPFSYQEAYETHITQIYNANQKDNVKLKRLVNRMMRES